METIEGALILTCC